MLFNSFEFVLAFLPITLIGYYFISKISNQYYSKVWLLVCSLFFYGWWNPKYLILIISSILINFLVSNWISKFQGKKRILLIIGLLFNLGLLGYYKYTNFFVDNLNVLLGLDFTISKILLPLGISFFTFQQVAFLVDSYKGFTKEYDFINYGVFVSFFPQLIAGPIVHHEEIMSQFIQNKQITVLNYSNLSKGLFIFMLGLSKKIIIADTFSLIANSGYSAVHALSTVEAWITSFSYSIQLYYDFSGYSDMAIGLGLLFNIQLPLNFNSPYKSANIQEFWRRWHITLSRFLRDYLYIPFGGNRRGDLYTYRNLLLTFVIGGIWHGAGWTFIFWGFLHGIALIINRLYTKTKFNLPNYINVLITFFFVNITWVFFRASNWSQATDLLKKMFTISTGNDTFILISSFLEAPIWILGVILLFYKNVNQLGEEFKLDRKHLIFIILLILINIIFMNSSISKEFLYYDF